MVAVILLIGRGMATGQVAQGELRGVVSDESGAVLPGATVTATQSETTFGTSSYLKPGSSTNLFYQPRQVQFGLRASF